MLFSVWCSLADCTDLEKSKEDNEQCKADLQAVIDSKDRSDCDQLKEVCECVSLLSSLCISAGLTSFQTLVTATLIHHFSLYLCRPDKNVLFQTLMSVTLIDHFCFPCSRAFQVTYQSCINGIRRTCRSLYYDQIVDEKYDFSYGDDKLSVECKKSHQRKVCLGLLKTTALAPTTTTVGATRERDAGDASTTTRGPGQGSVL